MPEQDLDRLEQFFRKAAGKADVPFNEEDWKKLEAQLDAADAAKGVSGKTVARIIAATVLVVATSIALWQFGATAQFGENSDSGVEKDQQASVYETPESSSTSESLPKAESELVEPQSNSEEKQDPTTTTQSENLHQGSVSTTAGENAEKRDGLENEASTAADQSEQRSSLARSEAELSKSEVKSVVDSARTELKQEKIPVGIQSLAATEEPTRQGDVQSKGGDRGELSNQALSDQRLAEATTIGRDAVPERDKQKAVVELPGAEEEETIEEQSVIQEEHASDNMEHVTAPRLSLLLSFAPDFSGTSMAPSSAPGKAFGAMIHYHPFSRWSISVGAIKNYKQYTGSGEDYKPPKNYWKYYTNGLIPEKIDGSCDVLEFPIMIQYSPIVTQKSRLNLSAGTSSYLMQSESYRYHFAGPNPGAREGWDSRKSSRFLFNMLNFSVGYERQVMPGLMVGVEPYAKLPLEEIGWSNLRLFSSGVSLTLRYTILRRKELATPTRSRSPD